ncbi:MAG: di-trans,poly-cis-decaprenylcistransferase [Gammaproteobacteria bacterium]|nr:di-trans,poly-cis-decaprenylcistransferase [Gammaproteobacteria bacterium]MCP5202028.1 di-trans,poly-cis-decaprenylcistransferase [Gammaproteobacteria bacterium]
MEHRLPRHVAIIMDGNGRWARRRQLPRIAGHRAGVENVRNIVRYCAESGIEVLTLFAFSSENWRRPPAEVKLLFELFLIVLDQEVERLHEAGVRLRIIGDRAAFSAKLQRAIREAEVRTAGNDRLHLVIAANYGGRWDIAQAARTVAAQVARGELEVDAIDADLIASHLELADLPEPDLFIRSGGEQRISNYLLWQLAYSELYFTDCLWPDFDTVEFEKALDSYIVRERRFGMTGEQVSGERDAVATPVPD